jgi:hypothetical protein
VCVSAPIDPPASAAGLVAPSRQDHYEWLILFLVAWANRNRVSETAMENLFRTLARFFTWLRVKPQLPGAPADTPSVEQPVQWPSDLKHAGVSSCNVRKDNFTKYVMCPKDHCGALHKMANLLQPGDAVEVGEAPIHITHCDWRVSQRSEAPLIVEPEDEEDGSAGGAGLCGASLFKVIPSLGTKAQPKPHLTYLYHGLESPLKILLRRKGFEEKCERWRNGYQGDWKAGDLKRTAWADVRWDHNGRPILPEEGDGPVVSDVHQAQLWEDYLYTDDQGRPYRRRRPHAEAPPRAAGGAAAAAAAAGHRSPWLGGDTQFQPSEGPLHPLLAQPGTLALALNVDWFQPYASENYTMGAIYMTVLNLPREERYLVENIILVGILPGPRETPREKLQAAMRPLRDELLKFFRGGVTMATADHPKGRKVKAFLLNVVCDSPARQAIAGFMGFSSFQGCAHCTQRFGARKGATYPDYSWSATLAAASAARAIGDAASNAARAAAADGLAPLRNNDTQRQHALEWSSTAAQESHASQYGARYCTFMDLPYYDAVRCAPLDMMHNFFLGTCKAVMGLITAPYSVQKSSLRHEAWRSGATDDQKKRQAEAEEQRQLVLKQKHATKVRTLEGKIAAERNEAEKGKLQQKLIETNAATAADGKIQLPALLSDTDLEQLQRSMNHSECPRDVGRMPHKIARHMASFKAAEWSNWISIFAVPHLAELMREKNAQGVPFHFTTRHLQLFIDLREISLIMLAYAITPTQMNQVERLFHSVLRQVEDLFGANSIKPNLHCSLHIADMLLDFGPPAGWSCNAYERMNGLLSNVPINKAYPELGTMRRGIQLIAVANSASQRLDALPMDHAEGPKRKDYEKVRTMLLGTDEAGAEELSTHADAISVHRRTTASGAVQLRYQWKSPAMYATFMKRVDVVGTEPFPGAFRNEDKTFLESFQFTLPHGPETWKQNRHMYIKPDHFVNCLTTHYLHAYKDELITSRRAQSNPNVPAFDSLPPLPAESGSRAHDDWVRKHAMIHVNTLFHVFSTLDMSGQVWGSALGAHRNRYVSIYYNVRGTWLLGHAHVNFFFSHEFAVPPNHVKKHYFACVSWHETIDQDKASHWKAIYGHLHGDGGASARVAAAAAAASVPHGDDGKSCMNFLAQHFPFVNFSDDKCLPHIMDIVPVQTLNNRWAPCKRSWKGFGEGERTQYAQVLPLPPKGHA